MNTVCLGKLSNGCICISPLRAVKLIFRQFSATSFILSGLDDSGSFVTATSTKVLPERPCRVPQYKSKHGGSA